MTRITEENCKQEEFFETPEWSTEEILNKEPLPKVFVDPCFGLGAITNVVLDRGYQLHKAIDKTKWGRRKMAFKTTIGDYLDLSSSLRLSGKGVIMNPPFSLATEFVEASLEADKILCFQRFSWWESERRKDFWHNNPPNKVYICGNRATCWRADLPKGSGEDRYDHAGKKLSGSSTAHAWFVWDKKRKSKGGSPTLHHIWR